MQMKRQGRLHTWLTIQQFVVVELALQRQCTAPLPGFFRGISPSLASGKAFHFISNSLFLFSAREYSISQISSLWQNARNLVETAVGRRVQDNGKILSESFACTGSLWTEVGSRK